MPTAMPSSPATSTKRSFQGLVAMGELGFADVAGDVPDNGMEEINAHPGVYVGADVNVTWAQLEPSPGVFDDSAIDSALATIAAYNAKYPGTPVAAKLRVYAGPNVPAWLFSVAGGPITVSNSKGSMQIAAFWTSGYDAAWQGLQSHLASTYDPSTAIAEVAVSSCSSLSAEPFVISLDSASLSAMRAYGFDDAAYMSCLTNAANDYAMWKATPLDYTFNTYRLSDGTSLQADPSFTIGVMAAFRSALGSRAVLANHGLQSPLDAGAQPIYTEIGTLGAPAEFQGYSPTIDWPSSVALAVSYHASEIEIWPTVAAGGSANLSLSQLQQFAADLTPGQAATKRRSLR
jgi:hypothetical protein